MPRRRTTAGAITYQLSEGDSIQAFPLYRFWAFLRMTGAGRYPSDPGFSRLVPNSVIWASEAQKDRGLDFVASCVDRWWTQTSDPVGFGEFDKIRVYTVMRGFRPFWYLIEPSPPPPQPSASLTRFAYYMRRMFAIMKRAPLHLEKPPPMDTNAGWPTFASSGWAKVLGACLPIDDLPTADAFISHTGLAGVTRHGFGLGSRTGTVDYEKWLPDYARESAGIIARTESSGTSTRRRHVYMGPSGTLLPLEPLAAAIKYLRHKIPLLWHKGDATWLAISTLRAAQPSYVTWEGDLSGYDLSVHAVLFDTIVSAAESELPQAHPLLKSVHAWRTAEARPILTPSDQGAGWAVDRPNGIRSGLLTTSGVGTLINFCAALVGLEAAGIVDPFDEIMRRRIALAIQGDDTLYVGPPIAVDAFVGTYADLGLRMKLVPGWRFLMRHMTPLGPLPLAARIMQGTGDNEHEVGGEWFTPIAVLGLASRWGSGPDERFADDVRQFIRLTNLYDVTGVYDGPSAQRWLRSNDAWLRGALQHAAAAAEIRDAERRAEYSEIASALFEFAVMHGYSPADIGYSDRYWRLCRIVAMKPATERIAIALRLWTQWRDGATDSNLDATALTLA